MGAVIISPKIKNAVADAIRVAISYQKLTGCRLGISGEIGEILVCRHEKFKSLKLKWLSDQISPGYDAIDKDGKQYQIKTKANNHKGTRLSTFSRHRFDFAILAIFNERYEIKELWHAPYRKLEPVILKHVRRNPSLREFMQVAKRIL